MSRFGGVWVPPLSAQEKNLFFSDRFTAKRGGGTPLKEELC